MRRLPLAGLVVAALLLLSLISVLQFGPKTSGPGGVQSSDTLNKLGLKMDFNYTRGGDPPPAAVWAQTYGGASLDRAHSVIATIDGGYAFAGITQSFGVAPQSAWLLKTNSTGGIVWSKTFGGISTNWAQSLIQNPDGSFIVAGYTNSTGAVGYNPARGAGGYDAWLFKVDSDGNLLWEQLYGGTSDDFAYSVSPTSDGGYVLAGATNSAGTAASAAWLVKVDSSGNEQWNKTYGGTFTDAIYSAKQTVDGGYILTGAFGAFGVGVSSVWLIKTDSIGNPTWNFTFGGGGSDVGYAVQLTNDGGYAIAGSASGFGAGMKDMWLIKTDSAGGALWNRTFGGSGDETAYSMIVTGDNAFLLAGNTTSSGAGLKDFFFVKVDVGGNEIWNATAGGAADDSAFSVAPTDDGGFVVAGSTLSFGAGSDDAWVIKFAPDFFISPYLADGNVNATVFVGNSIPHAPCGPANTGDTAGGMEVAEALGSYRMGSGGQYFLDTDVAKYNDSMNWVYYTYPNITNIIAVGGPGVNMLSYRYFFNPNYALVYYQENFTSGVVYIITPTNVYNSTTWVSPGHDLGLIESVYVPWEGRWVMEVGGFGGDGTRAMGLALQMANTGQLPFTLQGRAMLIQWIDSNGNAKVDTGDTYNVVEVVP